MHEEDKTAATGSEQPEPAPDWEAELDSYPLREPSEDPGWAVVTVKIWMWTDLFFIAFIMVLLILGLIYE